MIVIQTPCVEKLPGVIPLGRVFGDPDFQAHFAGQPVPKRPNGITQALPFDVPGAVGRGHRPEPAGRRLDDISQDGPVCRQQDRTGLRIPVRLAVLPAPRSRPPIKQHLPAQQINLTRLKLRVFSHSSGIRSPLAFPQL